MFKPKDLMKPDSNVEAGESQRDDYGMAAVQPYLEPMWSLANRTHETGKGQSILKTGGKKKRK